MKLLREIPAPIAWLEGGELSETMRDELRDTVNTLNEAAGPKGERR